MFDCASPAGDSADLAADDHERVHLWRAFYRRWQLFRLVAPGLPDPPGPLYADPGVHPTPEHLRDQMVTIRIPRHHPLPDEEELRRRLAESVERREDAHLGDWKRLSAAGNTGKGGLQRYTRLFALQHYWRVLHQRHSRGVSPAARWA